MQAIVWSKEDCTFCEQSKSILDKSNIPYEERKIGEGWTKEQLLEAVPSARSVPQIFIDEQYIGGFQQLQKFLKEKA